MKYTNVLKQMAKISKSIFTEVGIPSMYKGTRNLSRTVARGTVNGMYKHPYASGALSGGVGAGVSGVGSVMSLLKKERPQAQDIANGSGYISWSKRNGLPGNNLSTNGLGLSLNKLRHTSII